MNNKCKTIIKLIIIILLPILAIVIAHLLVNYHPKPICIWKNLFHDDCFGCGITRAFLALCKLDFAAAWNYNPRIYIVAVLLAFIWVNELIKTIKNIGV